MNERTKELIEELVIEFNWRYPQTFEVSPYDWAAEVIKMTQCEKIIDYIKRYGSITTWDAFKDLGITRLASRIHDLTEKGYEFDRKIEKTKNRDYETVTYTRYSFKEEREDKKDEH